MKNLDTIYLRISPGKFHFLKFILEGYDNLGILSSYESAKGIVIIRYPAEMTQDLFGLLGSLSRTLSEK
jgi:hypothetical protein